MLKLVSTSALILAAGASAEEVTVTLDEVAPVPVVEESTAEVVEGEEQDAELRELSSFGRRSRGVKKTDIDELKGKLAAAKEKFSEARDMFKEEAEENKKEQDSKKKDMKKDDKKEEEKKKDKKKEDKKNKMEEDLKGEAKGMKDKAKKNAEKAKEKALEYAKDLKEKTVQKKWEVQEKAYKHFYLPKSKDHIIQFMHAADHYKSPLYYRFRGSFTADNKLASKDNVIYGGSETSHVSASTNVTQGVYSDSDSHATEEGSNGAAHWDSDFKMGKKYALEGDAFIGGELTSDTSDVTITTPEEEECEDEWVKDTMCKSITGPQRCRNAQGCQWAMRYHRCFPKTFYSKWSSKKWFPRAVVRWGAGHHKRQLSHKYDEEPDVTITDKDSTYTGYLGGDLSGKYSDTDKTSKDGDIGLYHTSHNGSYDSYQEYDHDTTQEQTSGSDSHKGDYSSDKDSHKQKQDLDLKYLVEGVDASVGMQMLDEFGDLLGDSKKGKVFVKKPFDKKKSKSVTVTKTYSDSDYYKGDVDGKYTQIAGAAAIGQGNNVAAQNSAQINAGHIIQNIDVDTHGHPYALADHVH